METIRVCKPMPPMWLNNFGFVIPDQAVTNGIFAYRLRNGRELNTDDIERLLDPMDLRMIRSPDGNYFTANWTISDLNLTMLAWSLDAFAAGEYPTYYHALVNLFLNEGYHLGEEDTPGPNEVAVCTYAASLVVGFGSGHNVPYNELRLEFNRRATGVIPDTSIMFRKFDGAMERALENSFGFTIPEVLLGLISQIVASDIMRNYPKCRTFFHPSEPVADGHAHYLEGTRNEIHYVQTDRRVADKYLDEVSLVWDPGNYPVAADDVLAPEYQDVLVSVMDRHGPTQAEDPEEFERNKEHAEEFMRWSKDPSLTFYRRDNWEPIVRG